MTASQAAPSFRLAYVPGVTPGKWVRIWQERLPDVPLHLLSVPAAEAAEAVRGGGADAVLLRLPADRAGLHAIPLYTETTVVVVPKDHLVAAVDEVSLAELADETVLHPLDDTLGWERPPGVPALERPATTGDAVELVAAGVGVLVVPQSLARLHHRRDLTYRPVSDAPASRVALSWPEEETTDLMEQFIGIVRGRTVNSTRGRPQTQPRPGGGGRPGPGERTRKAAGAASAKARGTGRGGSGTGRGGGRGTGRGRSRRRS
ncbi:LysR substrate-binding domain-containing protein [Streptomyces sp. WMMC897]|uniref:LysR substrate-binding domain-containing protein n=1 Tax=Streptomyces sp. WMMC897 TaxID=3014782 RepID=UPI0022B6FAEC|nr:LysR substrate-binding domain-containing protein [Streptomyces sp. WMMC897]MCZ7413365.1 LysR substrate-binding domain-containing protein [Streptomyces sp. WMMC897]